MTNSEWVETNGSDLCKPTLFGIISHPMNSETGPISFEFLKRRAEVLRTVRVFFDGNGFTEVETPVRIPAPANEAFLERWKRRCGFLLRPMRLFSNLRHLEIIG